MHAVCKVLLDIHLFICAVGMKTEKTGNCVLLVRLLPWLYKVLFLVSFRKKRD